MTVALARYDAARHALSVARSVDEVKDIRDKAQAMAAYARQAKDTELVEWATEIKVRAERRAGQMLAEIPRNPNGGRPRENQATLAQLLDDNDIAATTAKRWQQLAAVSESQFEKAVAAAKEVAGEVTTAALLRLNGKPHVAHNSGDNEWYTPPEYIAAARNAMGGIDLDPASTPEANKIVGAAKFFTAEQNGLARPWPGRIWLNPPYASDWVGAFADKLVSEYCGQRTVAACVLVNNGTETEWFQHIGKAAAAVVFPRGRVRFWAPGKSTSTPLQGQAVLYLGKEAERFRGAFGSFGWALVA